MMLSLHLYHMVKGKKVRVPPQDDSLEACAVLHNSKGE